MVRERICRSVLAAMMCVGAGVVTSGAAHASTTLVLSDTIKFSGVLFPLSTPGFDIVVTTCSLTSDGEPVAFVCQGSGQIIINPLTNALSGTFNSSSADGQIQSTFNLTTTGPNTAKLNGSAVEMDAPDRPGGKTHTYDAIVKGSVTINGAVTPPLIAGTIKVKESPTAP